MTALENIVHKVEKHGWILLEGAEAQALLTQINAGMLGKLLPQDKNGTTIYDVKLDTTVENTASSKGSLPIEPHTDGALTDTPPRLVALYGKHVPEGEQCQTHMCLATELYDSLTEEESRILKLPDPRKGTFKYTFQKAVYDIYWITEKDLPQARANLTPEKKAAVAAMAKAFMRHQASLTIKQGDLLMIANYKVVHSRGNVNSPDRHLLRYWISVE